MNHPKRRCRNASVNPNTTRRRLRQELLEPRHLLALDVSFESGLLDIRATDSDDIIVTAESNRNGSALVKINGRQLDSSPVAAADVLQIRAIGGLFSYIDLSAARDNDEAFSSLRETVESEPDDSWRIDFQPISSVLEKIYFDPVARSQGLSWTEKVARLEAWVGDLEGTRQHSIFTRVGPISQSAGAEGGGDMAAASSSFDGGIVDIITPVEQPEYVDWMTFTVDHHATPGSSAKFAFNGMTVDYSITNGSAVSPEDYDPQAVPSLPLEWMDGEEGQNRVISIDIEQDVIWEEDEDLHVTLSGLVNFSGDEGEATLGNSQATGVIENDDPVPTVSIVSVETVDEDAGTVAIGVSLSNPSSVPVSVQWSSKDGTATLGDDYSGASGTIIFAPLETYKEIVITILPDALDEYDETFSICLVGATNGLISSTSYESLITIVDDDLPPEISIHDAVGNESGANIVAFLVTLDAPSGKSVTVNFATQDGTAKQGLDYVSQSGQRTFLPGQTEQLIEVEIIDDLLAEDDENFFVNLSSPVNASMDDAQGEGTITSDDADPSISIDDVTVTEGDPGDNVIAVFTFSLSGPSGRPIQVTAQTVDGTAIASDDYDATSDTFTFGLDAAGHQTAGPLEVEFSVPIVEDLVYESVIEQFFVNLMNTVNVGIGDGQGAGTIIDDDPEVDLDAYKIDHNQKNGILDDGEEETEGAFLPVNNDDDDYDSQNIADLEQVGAIVGENDLLPILIRKASINIPGATYHLNIPSHVKVWQADDRTGEVTSFTQIDANVDTELYVEGVSEGSGLIKINWTKPGTLTRLDLDRIRISTFTWTGPLNVPDYSIYTYTATGGHPDEGQWLDPDGGVTQDGTDGELLDASDILWTDGAEIGKAVYNASNDYIWGLDVNIVAISYVVLNFEIEAGPVQEAPDSPTIKSRVTQTPPTMNAKLEATIVGPVRDGKMRGVIYMEVGLIQNVRIDRWRAHYPDEPKWRVHDMQSNTRLLDTLSTNFLPWYSFNAMTSPLSDQLFNDDVEMSDTPSGPASDTSVYIGANGDSLIDTNDLVWKFWTYFAVRTIDPRNGADSVYTQRAESEWTFDGSGTFDNQGPNKFGDWTSSGGNNEDQAFMNVNSGDVVPVTMGPTANQVELSTGFRWSDTPN